MNPEEFHEDDQRAGPPLPRRQAETFESFSLETRKLWRDLIAAFQYLKGPYEKAVEGLFYRGM